MLYNLFMDEKELTQIVNSVPVSALVERGLSEGLALAIRGGRRAISTKTAKKLGYVRRVVVTFEPIEPVRKCERCGVSMPCYEHAECY